MRIERLSVENLRDGVFCPRGGERREEVYSQMEAWLRGDRLRGQIAWDANNDPAGFVLYYPIEEAPLDVEGTGFYMVQCLFVKPEYQGRGTGRKLIDSAVADARENGASGLAVEGFHGVKRGAFSYMPDKYFERAGMTPGESRGPGTLYYIALKEDAAAPRYLERRFEPERDDARVRIDILDCKRCYVGTGNIEVVKTVLEDAANADVKLVVHDQSTRQAVLDKGMSSGIFIDGRLTFFRGPVSEDDIWNAIEVARSARERAMDR